ncbi:hypothetical protein [Halovivax limisalsi]|uniref:hypothetical protein n=1 Tax=Halovivax limisalsi TaxID=1453760 RepID=UPI001FFD5631|nr:hypothetical protein [Halovivax limisalsi]
MDDALSRRRLVQVGATGTALTIAGCQFQQDDGADGNETDDTDGEPTVDGSVTVAVVPYFDQAELQSTRQEIQQEVQSGNMTQQEAQSELQSAQDELVSTALDDLQSRLETETNLSVTDTSTKLGLALVAGDPTGLIASLELEAVSGIIPQSRFQSE